MKARSFGVTAGKSLVYVVLGAAASIIYLTGMAKVLSMGAGAPEREAIPAPLGETRDQTLAEDWSPNLDASLEELMLQPGFSLREPPSLKPLVAKGVLPEVGDRVGAEPLVLEGIHGGGRYGGTIFTTYTNPIEANGLMGRGSLFHFSAFGRKKVPAILKGWEIFDDGRTFILHFRKGARWSDGQLFTSNDFLYWWEKEVLHFGLEASRAPFMMAGGYPAEVRKIDDFRLRITFAEPNTLFLDHAFGTMFSPSHYLLRYHPEFGEPALIEELMEKLNIGSPMALYARLSRLDNPELPTMAPWVFSERLPYGPVIYKRNPYYYAIDREGNQLPYVDAIVYEARSQRNVLQTALAGGLDFQERNIPFSQYTILKERSLRGQIELKEWINGHQASWLMYPNLNLEDSQNDGENGKKRELLNNREFRRAISLSIDRERISNTIYMGMVRPARIPPLPEDLTSSATKGQETFYDPDEAERIFASLGLKKKGLDGFRRFPDGSRMTWYIYVTKDEHQTVTQAVVRDLEKVGIRMAIKAVDPNLFWTIRNNRTYDFIVWKSQEAWNAEKAIKTYLPIDAAGFWAPAFGMWYAAGGREPGESRILEGYPPPLGHPVWEAYALLDEMHETLDQERRKELAEGIVDIAEREFWLIAATTPPPRLIVTDPKLKNVPDSAVFGGASPGNVGPETFYFEDGAGTANKMTKEEGKSTASKGEGREYQGSMLKMFLAVLLAFLVYAGTKHRYVRLRLMLMVPTLAVISLVVFAIINSPPGNFAEAKRLEAEATSNPDAIALVAELEKLFPLDEPFLVRYADWLGLKWFGTFEQEDRGLLQGHLGYSMNTLEEVGKLVGDRIGITILITSGTMLFTWAVSIPLGIYSAVRKNTITDYAITLVGFIGISIPNFLLALLLLYVSDRYWGYDATGLFSQSTIGLPFWSGEKLLDLAGHLWVPIVVLGTGGTAGMIRVMRGNLLDEIRKPYVVTALAKGVPRWKLILKYPVRIAINPFVSHVGNILPSLISGGAIVAIVLSLPTVSPLLLEALMAQDTYLAGSLIMILSFLSVVGVLLSDLLLAWLDPRIRYEKRA